ncbi:MAG TPA: cytochrome P450 [Acidimicrobiia bacterium]|nr:cytochrome P450 [Acidimicrobiia bacterium]
MTTANDSRVYYDPYDSAISADPFPTFRRLRDEAPIYYNERYDVWALSRHADVEKALVNWETFSNSRSDILEIIKGNFDLPSGVVMFEDPPTHTMHRGLMSRVFTPRRMSELEDQVREYCRACLDPLVGADRFDFVQDLGLRMPMRVIGMLLGIPESDQPAVREMADAAIRTKKGEPMAVQESAIADGSMFADYIEWRSQHPADDLMTVLLNAEFEDESGTVRKLSRDEVLSYTQVIAGAGNETTGRLIGWLGRLLGDHPDERRALVEDPSLIPNAVEETLRFQPTGLHLARYVLRDIEYYDTTVPAGSAILLLVGSANRDERRHPDPDRYDVRRDLGAHLTFGYGLHFCLGASLARLEGRVALDEVLKRFPNWEVDDDNVVVASTSTVRGFESLPVFVR